MISERLAEVIRGVSEDDVEAVSDNEYVRSGAWDRRGGASVFHQLAKHWDQLDSYLRGSPYYEDIMMALSDDMAPHVGNVVYEVQALRRQLLLIEAKILAIQEENKMSLGGTGGAGSS